MSNTNKTLKDIFLESCHENNIEKVQNCLSLEVDMNCVSDDGLCSGLAIATRNEYKDLFDILLACPGIDVNLKTKCQCDSEDKDVDDVEETMETALMIACNEDKYYAQYMIYVP